MTEKETGRIVDADSNKGESDDKPLDNIKEFFVHENHLMNESLKLFPSEFVLNGSQAYTFFKNFFFTDANCRWHFTFIHFPSEMGIPVSTDLCHSFVATPMEYVRAENGDGVVLGYISEKDGPVYSPSEAVELLYNKFVRSNEQYGWKVKRGSSWISNCIGFTFSKFVETGIKCND